MSSRSQLFVGRLPIDIRERDVEQVFEKYGRLLRCDVKYGMFGSTRKKSSGVGTGMAYAFVDYDDKRDAEIIQLQTASTSQAMPIPCATTLFPLYRDAIKYENGREIKGQSIVVEWARGPSYRSRDSSSYPRNSNFRRDGYGRSSRQNSEECYRCRRTGHWARDCPDQDRDRYYPRSSRNRSRSRSRSRSYRNKRSVSASRSRSRDRGRRSFSGYRQKSRSVSRDKRMKYRSPSVSASPSKSRSRSRSRSVEKSRRKSEKSKKKVRTPSKSRSRSPSKSASRSPNFARKDSRSPQKSPENYKFEDKRASPESDKNRSRSRSPRKSRSRSLSKEKTRAYDNESDHSVSRSKSR
ncbi:uncharacterized protein TNCT_687902 [Trichonephila clavata]|uniref:Uncharacterized protein n=1 Tax=Trichonephila clavata TaxID=2740835 RepID=A0A8X6HNJ7_TRICU|nr:uncharacterized protein TNCT_687902 [Trichonephila clavata]